jgi:hypothetical protein
MVFLNSPYRETPKNILKQKFQENNIFGVGWFLRNLIKYTSRSVVFFV